MNINKYYLNPLNYTIVYCSSSDPNFPIENINKKSRYSELIDISQIPKGQIFKQIPPANSKVKKNRRVLIIINSIVPQVNKAPNVVGLSLRQAQSNIEAAGFQIGKLKRSKYIN